MKLDYLCVWCVCVWISHFVYVDLPNIISKIVVICPTLFIIILSRHGNTSHLHSQHIKNFVIANSKPFFFKFYKWLLFFLQFWNVFTIPLPLPPILNHSCRGALKASHLITIYFSFLFCHKKQTDAVAYFTINRLILDNSLTNLLILFKHLYKGKQRQCKCIKKNLLVLTQNETTRD